MRLPRARGPLSEAVLAVLADRLPLDAPALGEQVADLPRGFALMVDEDAQLTLWTLAQLHYRGFAGVRDDWEWDPGLIGVRRALEERLLQALRQETSAWVEEASAATGDVASRLFTLTERVPGAPLAAYLQRDATPEQLREYLVHKSVYHLQESDPQSFVLPRLAGPAKVALAELQYDEYGAGRPGQLHQELFARGLEASGLSSAFGAYLDQVPAPTLLVVTTMNLLVLRRALAAAAMGHLGAFEATSSEPCRRIAGGCRRLGLPDAVAGYFDEHIEADAVHEQLALRGICATMAAGRPEVETDLFFGAAAYLITEAVAGEAMLAAWAAGRSSLLPGAGAPADRTLRAVAS